MTVTWAIDPIALELGPLSLSWYGLFFAGGFLAGLQLMYWIYRREGRAASELDRLLWYVIAGVVIGMRLVHCLFYDPQYFLANPLEILKVWQGGYASHGGALGLLIAVYFFCKAPGRPRYLWLLDRLTIPAVLAGAMIRIGNFFNSEILGEPTQGSFGVVFARVDSLPRHPAQLYEAAAYLAIFAVLLWLYRAGRGVREGLLTGWYLALVFAARIAIEFFKSPQAVYEQGFAFSVGQYLSLPFVAAGVALILYATGGARWLRRRN